MAHSHSHAHERRNVLDDNKAERRDGQGNMAARGQSTVVQIVYKTMSATFDGPIAGYSTLNEDNNPAPTNAPDQQLEPTSTQQSGGTSSNAATSAPTAIRPPSNTDTDTNTVLVQATGTPNRSPTLVLDNTQLSLTSTASASTTASASSTADPASSSSSPSTESGTSAATTAGIAFGVIGGVLFVGLLVFLVFRRRRRQTQRQQLGEDDEKVNGAVAREPEPMLDMPARTNPNAPRISLRPVTQFFPNWSLEKHTGKGLAMNLDGAGAMGSTVGSNHSDRPGTSQSNHSANPFGNQAERVPTPVSERVPTPVMSPVIEEDSEETPVSPSHNVLNENASVQVPPATDGAAVAAVAGAGAFTRKASMRNQNPHNVDYTVPAPLGPVPPSPSGTEFSMTSTGTGLPPVASKGAAAIAAAGGPPNSTVHRVQLDFKPTLEDEMELKAGDLVRLLHEYDDGWALVIRLDRSKQGVVPRTCLSTRPVKPRPAQGRPPVNPSGYARGPNAPPSQRSMTPQGQQRPMTPQGMQANGPGSSSRPRMGPGPGQRPASPAGPPMNQSPTGRPMSPAGRPISPGGRPISPGGRYQGPPSGRPQSPGGMNQRSSPPGPSSMNPAQPPASGASTGAIGRKPVPGQAY